jgi:hypothetical protein
MTTRLYDLADQFLRLAPWTWMHEEQLIGLQHPDTNEIAWISIMGAAGNHRTLALYLGTEAVQRFNLIQQHNDHNILLTRADIVSLILETRQLQATFAFRDELFPHELASIKSLKRKYRGENWPAFRSFRQSLAPVTASPEEASWLEFALEQSLIVAPRLRHDPFANLAANTDHNVALVRSRSSGSWQDSWHPEITSIYSFPEPEPSELLVASIRKLPRSKPVATSWHMIPEPVGKPGEAFFPYLSLTVEAASGKIVSIDTANPLDGISPPDSILRAWLKVGINPSAILTNSAATAATLAATARALDTPLHINPHIPALDVAANGLADVLGQI